MSVIKRRNRLSQEDQWTPIKSHHAIYIVIDTIHPLANQSCYLQNGQLIMTQQSVSIGSLKEGVVATVLKVKYSCMILKWLQTYLNCLQIHFEEQKLQNQSFDIQSKESSWFRESFATSLLMLLLFDCMMNDFQKHFSFEWSNFLFGTYILWVVNCAGLGLINHLWKSHVICNYDEEWWCSVHNYNRVSCFLDGWKFFTQRRGGPRKDWMEFNLKLYFHVDSVIWRWLLKTVLFLPMI